MPEITVFSPPEQCGQVLALSVDDEGRVFAAVTERSFGRGTVSAMGDPEMMARDRALRSTTAREALTAGWLASGKLGPLLERSREFYQAAGDGPGNFLTKYSESVVWLTDVNHDGKAESAATVASAFRDPLDGPGSTLLALPGGRWLFGCTPHLWRLEDRNADQRAEERSVVAAGFGLSNEPWGGDLHGLMEAPDGWIYWAMGERGYALRDAGGKSVRGMGQGAIFRCRPDGSSLEVVATGLRQPKALAMLDDGRLLAADGTGASGKTRLLTVIPGADYGWRTEAVTAPGQGWWFEDNMDAATPPEASDTARPRWATPCDAIMDGQITAMEVLRDGTVLAASRLPEGNGELVRYRIDPAHPGSRPERMETVWQGGIIMAMAQAPDGTVYFADWGATVDARSRVRIHRLSWPGVPAEEAGQVTEILRSLPELAVRELKSLLEHPVPRVALRARQRLESMRFQDSMEALLQIARRGPTLRARLHGLRGAGAVARQDAALLNELTAFHNDEEPALRAAAATLLGEGTGTVAPPVLRRALADESQPVRLAAAAAIARIKPSAILTDLIDAAAANLSRNALVRGSLAHAMAATVPAPALAQATLDHASDEVRLTAVLALRRLAAPEAAAFLTDRDPVTAAEAARAVYDLPLRVSYPALSRMLDTPAAAEPVLRRALAAAAWLGTATEAERVAAFAVAEEIPPALRQAALTTLARWDQTGESDPVYHRQESPLPRLPGTARALARTAAEALKNHADPAVAAQALTLWNATAPASPSARLALANNASAAEPDRLAALLSLIAANELSSEQARTLTNPATAGVPPPLKAEARSLLMRRDPKNAVALLSEALTTGGILEKQAAIRTLDRLPGQGGENERTVLELARRLGSGGIERSLQVEVWDAMQRRDIETRSPWRRATEAWHAALSTNFDPLAPWRMAMDDGDAAAGRVIFETHPEANCLSCHAVGGIGGLKGPDLDGVAGRLNADGLLESLIRPSARIVKGYAAPADSEGDGETLSPMPPMGSILTPRELRDLMAWLKTLKDS